jgi:hypothetical protein
MARRTATTWARLSSPSATSSPACVPYLSYTDVDLAIRGRAIGLPARVRYGDLLTAIAGL